MQDKRSLGGVDVLLKEFVKWYDSLDSDGLLDCSISARNMAAETGNSPLELVKVTARRLPNADRAMQTFKPMDEPNAWMQVS